MRVKVRYYAMARDAAGKRDEAVTLPGGSTVLDLVHVLIDLYGPTFKGYVYDDEGRLLDYLMFSVNDVNTLGLDGFETTLRDGDTVRVMPPIGGG
ncbi:MAG: MoaD/ThiS family protein [Candidatus Bathyarchaeota archaeon]